MEKDKIKKLGKTLLLIGFSIYLLSCLMNFVNEDIIASLAFVFLALPVISIGIFIVSLYLFLDKKSIIKKFLSILLILFILFIIDGFIFNYIPKYIAKGAIDKESEFMCNLLPFWDIFDSLHPVSADRSFLKENCYLEIALIKRDVSFCNEIEIKTRWHRCYIKTAITSENELICKELKNIEGENDSIFSKGAIKDCYASLAVIKGNQELCDEIGDEEYRDYCVKDFNEGIIFK